jgi:hypothetical protein
MMVEAKEWSWMLEGMVLEAMVLEAMVLEAKEMIMKLRKMSEVVTSSSWDYNDSKSYLLAFYQHLRETSWFR